MEAVVTKPNKNKGLQLVCAVYRFGSECRSCLVLMCYNEFFNRRLNIGPGDFIEIDTGRKILQGYLLHALQ